MLNATEEDRVGCRCRYYDLSGRDAQSMRDDVYTSNFCVLSIQSDYSSPNSQGFHEEFERDSFWFGADNFAGRSIRHSIKVGCWESIWWGGTTLSSSISVFRFSNSTTPEHSELTTYLTNTVCRTLPGCHSSLLISSRSQPIPPSHNVCTK